MQQLELMTNEEKDKLIEQQNQQLKEQQKEMTELQKKFSKILDNLSEEEERAFLENNKEIMIRLEESKKKNKRELEKLFKSILLDIIERNDKKESVLNKEDERSTDIESLEELQEKQEKNKEELEELSKEIENYNFKVIEKTFGEEYSKELEKNNSFTYCLNIEGYHKEQVIEDHKEKKGYSESILMTLPMLWNDQNEEQLKEYKTRLQEALKIRDERKKIIDRFYNKRKDIELINQKIGYYTSEAHKINKERMKNLEKYIISSQTLYDIGKKCQNDYFAQLKEEGERLFLEVERSFDNISEKYEPEENLLEQLGIAENENQLSRYNFKDIASKTQSVSMYKKQKAIFLDGERMKQLFDKVGSVSIPFGLMETNQNELEFKFTKLNHTLTTTSQKIFNACCSAQWIMNENKYPINQTIIEEETLYQLWKGDKTFSKRPNKDQLQQMKNEILGMSTNLSQMNFASKYNYLDEETKVKLKKEGSFLPVSYNEIEIERSNGQKYKVNCYIFDKIAPLFDFFIKLGMVNTAPLEIESVLKSSTMNDFISETFKEEIASLYYFKNTKKAKGNQKKIYITSEEELSSKEWHEKKIKDEVSQGFWRYTSTRTIESLFEEWLEIYKRNEKSKKQMKDEEELILSEATIRKTKQNFINSIVTFLREATQIDWKEKKWLESFTLYDLKGNIIDNNDYMTDNDKTEAQKISHNKYKGNTKKNPSIYKIEISIS